MFDQNVSTTLDTQVTFLDVTFSLFYLVDRMVNHAEPRVPVASLVAALVAAAGADNVLRMLKDQGHVKDYTLN